MFTKRKLQAYGAIILIALSIVYVAQPKGHIPPYDANLVRLAETELQGYCAGKTLWATGTLDGDKGTASNCRYEMGKKKSNKPDLRVVQSAFCKAIVDSGWEGTLDMCLGILASSQYWPTYDGGLSNQWNRVRPYPGSLVSTGGSTSGNDSRTGGHQGSTRDNAPSRSIYPG